MNKEKCYLFDQNHPVLSDLVKDSCEMKITTEECNKSIQDLPNNKSPGSDGINAESFNFFWTENALKVFEDFYLYAGLKLNKDKN